MKRSCLLIACVCAAVAGCRAQPQPSPAKKPDAQLRPLTLTHPGVAKAVVGSTIEATADGLPPGRTVDLLWQTVKGGWVIEDYFHFRGKKYAETSQAIGTAETGDDGRLVAHFTIPEDYGGVHEVIVADHGTPIAQGGVEVTQTFEITPKDGPIGTPIEVRVHGLGWRTMESTWVINWDNSEVGWISAAGTRGTATARFRASGGVGEHHVRVYSGYMGQSYLNHEQAPNAYLPRPAFTFRITPGPAPKAAYAEPYAKQPVPEPDKTTATASVTPSQGPVLTHASLKAGGLPANAPVSIVWGTWEGSRVSGNGFAPKEKELLQLKTADDGTLTASIEIPDDLGGLHTISIRAGDKPVARSHFVIETSIVSITPARGPAGTPVTIHLKGVGWTDYDNIYIATYDNSYMGYACGFNSRGDVVINFTAAGAPGQHLIDLYPGIYQGPEGQQQLYRLPQLTYADDHPGNRIPALRFAFEVTK